MVFFGLIVLPYVVWAAKAHVECVHPSAGSVGHNRTIEGGRGRAHEKAHEAALPRDGGLRWERKMEPRKRAPLLPGGRRSEDVRSPQRIVVRWPETQVPGAI